MFTVPACGPYVKPMRLIMWRIDAQGMMDGVLQIGSLSLASNLCLAPLAGYTNLPFRLTIRELGGVGLCTTDLVNARSLLERRPKALKLVETCPEDSPLAVQLFGANPDEMRAAAQWVESQGVAAIDINMGCPARKVCRVGSGAALMTDLDKTAALVRKVVEGVKVPVTVKMRLGWDENNITAPDLARALEDCGVAAVFVHGRTREQGFGGTVNLEGIRQVVAAVKRIPVIGNGDVTTPQAAKRMFEVTGCAGISIGRGAFYDPWIFQHTRHYLATGELLPEVSLEERLRVMRRHLNRMVEVFGEEHGCRMFRKIAPWYARRFGPAHEFNRRVALLQSRAHFEEIVAHFLQWRQQFLDENGELKPRFRPPPMVASFMAAEGEVAAIPVPKGPVERW